MTVGATLFEERTSGVLLHPTSLPGPHGCGDLGASAYHFVDWLATARQSLWQVLPLNPVGPGNSPYQSVSIFAGNPLLVDLDTLVQRGWLRDAPGPDFEAARVDYAKVVAAPDGAAARSVAGFRRAGHGCRPARSRTHFTAGTPAGWTTTPCS